MTYPLKQQYDNVDRAAECERLEEIRGTEGAGKVCCSQYIGKNISHMRVTDPEGSLHNCLYPSMVMEGYGKPIDQVTDLVLLLKALRDAIAAHQEAFVRKCILVGGITLGNIVYTKDPANLREGEGYGNLIDFDLSVKLDHLVSCHDLDFRTGTLAFYSVHIHRRIRDNKPYVPHYMDDLQGFFWVFIWILASYDVHHDGRASKIKQPLIHKRFQSEPEIAESIKHAFLLRCACPNSLLTYLSKNWDPILIELVRNLGSLFCSNVDVLPVPATDMVKEANEQAFEHYATILGYFDSVIARLAHSLPIIVAPANDPDEP
ncbi:hypothetical protein CVT24_001021 [Panaeolus cyanescens]|uniref:Fungal-type protein kinase domain-containing protein n=1 Tax=Panaeolus cyanescens TaxID=181874 RepID=A0A409WPL4_9AGAR|nr:hypothetical protein CVT24_001021 [Panaeolus cyanescens]